jgi:hypothetical protein
MKKMSDYQSYLAYLNTSSATPINSINYYKDLTQAVLDNDFKNSVNYKLVDLYRRENVTSTPSISNLGVRIIKPYSVSRVDTKLADKFWNINFSDLNFKIFLGDSFDFENNRWLVVESESQGSFYKSCMVERCNVNLKFTDEKYLVTSQGSFVQDSNGNLILLGSENIYSIWGISKLRTSDPNLEQYSIVSDSTMDIQIPYNSVSKLIRFDLKKGTRFLFGENKETIQAWQVVDIDNVNFINYASDGTIMDGYLGLKLKKSQKLPKDDYVNRVAWQPWFD